MGRVQSKFTSNDEGVFGAAKAHVDACAEAMDRIGKKKKKKKDKISRRRRRRRGRADTHSTGATFKRRGDSARVLGQGPTVPRHVREGQVRQSQSQGQGRRQHREQYARALRADTDGNSRSSTSGIVWLGLGVIISLCGVGDNTGSRAHTTIRWDDGFIVSDDAT